MRAALSTTRYGPRFSRGSSGEPGFVLPFGWRRRRNKLAFALPLCVPRYPGRLLASRESVPPHVVDFIGFRVDLDGDELADYAVRPETRHEHLAEMRRLYGFRPFSGRAARDCN